MDNKKTKAIKRALRDTFPIFAGYLVLGIGFGVMLAKRGFGTYWAAIMSCTMYAGSMQYVAVELLGDAVTVGYAIIMTLLVNIRHVFYGVSLIDKYRDAGWRRIYMMFALTDETYSLVSTTEVPRDIDKNTYYFSVSLFDQIYWICGCCIGALMGNLIEFNSAGIEYAMTALFVCIFADQWLSVGGRKLLSGKHISAMVGVGATLVSLIVCNIVGTEYFLIPSMIIILVSLILLRPVLDRKENKDAE